MDLGKIGYRVGVDDAEYYRKLKAVETSTDKSTERIGGMFSRMAGALGLLAAAWAGWTEARRYASELANIKSIAAELDLSKLRKDISSLDAVLGKSSEIANGVYFAYSAGVRGTEKDLVDFTAEIAKLAKTIGGGVTPVMDAATTMMNAYGLTVKDTGKLTDWFYQIVKSGKTTGPELAQSLGQIAATAAASGVSLEQLGAAMATLTTTMPTNIAVTSLAASLRALMNPTDETATLAKELGIQMDAAALKTKGLGGVMDEIYRKTGGNGDLIAKLFPAESSRAVIALAGTQLGTFKTNIVDFSNNAGAAAAGFAARVDQMDDDLNSLWITILKVSSALGKFAYDVLQPLIKFFGSLSSGSIELIAGLLGVVAGTWAVSKAISAMGSIRAVFSAMILDAAKLQRNLISLSRATGTATAANHGWARSFHMLNLVIKANPFVAILAVMLAGFAVIRSMVNRFEDDLAALQERAQKLTQDNVSKLEAGDTQRRADMDKIERLKELQAQQKLTSQEMDEARGLIFSLTGRYGEFGVAVDGVTGKITSQADSFDNLNKKMEVNRKYEMQRVLEAKKSELELLKNKVSTKGTLWSRLTHPIDTLGTIFSPGQNAAEDQLTEMVNKGKQLQAEIAAMQLELDLGGGGATPPKPGTETPNTGADVNRRAKQEAELELELLRKQNELAKDGELSKRDELELLQTEIKLQKKRVAYMTEAANVAKAIKGDGSKEHLEALTEQEKAQGRLYELERKRTEQSREYAREQAEIARGIAFAELTAKAWQDGQLTHAEKVKLAEQSIADQKARVLRYQTELNAAATEDERNAARKALADAQTALGQLLGDQRNLQGNGMAAGSFSAEALSGTFGPNQTEKQIAGDVRVIAREVIRNRNKNGNDKGLGT